ncbi:MAG: hypothetical protein AABY33_01555 [Pseudomonadota bacterium]
MGWQSKIVDGVKATGEYVGSFISRNGHAQQTVPAQHRLSSIAGMYFGWVGGDKVRDALFAKNQTSEGEFVEVKREDVPLILRPIYHKIEWNPHSEESSEKWKKLLHQTIPAFTAAAGTMAGSALIFQLNGRSAAFKETMRKMKNGEAVGFHEADTATQFGQSGIYTWLAAATAGAGASSAIPILFSLGISGRFAAANAAKINLTNSIGGNLNSERALGERMDKIVFYVKSAINSGGKISRDWSKIFVEQSLEPNFGKVLNVPGEKEKAIDIIHKTVQGIYDKQHKSGLRGEKLIGAVSKEIKNHLGIIKPTINSQGKTEYHGIEKFVREKLGYNFSSAILGNAIPWSRSLNEGFTKLTGIGKGSSAARTEEYIRQQERNAANPILGRG